MTAAAGLVRGYGVVLIGAGRRGGASRLTDGVGEGDQVVSGRRRRGEVAVVADEFPASRGGEAACVGFTEVVRVGFGEGSQRAHHRGRIAVDVGQRGDRLPGTAVTGAAPWGPHGGTLSLRGAEGSRHAVPRCITIRP